MATLAELKAQIEESEKAVAELRKQADAVRNVERAGVIQELRAKVAEYGITAADLRLATRATRKETARYRGPNGELWAGGRGRKPHWVVAALASGKSLSAFETK
jgi:DNA-binding protein H-NS